MNLKCKINGKEYPLVQGNTFADELNETLSSGSIILAGVNQITDIYPYDDIYIYTGEFKGYPFSDSNPKPAFYKHLLLDSFVEEVLNLDKGIYKYKIELMSETKKLEVIQLPNRSVTQPLLFEEKKSIWEYLKEYIELYSPKIKFAKNEYEWEYRPKYTLAPELEVLFKDTYSPDFTLNNPSLRELLSKFFIVKDCIPYVEDDVIYALDISKRNGTFDNNPKYVNLITGSMSSENYCNNLRREYSNALAQNKSGRLTEFLGFRNSDNALMTLENMRLEFSNDLYKINKFYMCYYKKATLTSSKNANLPNKTVSFLCRQDITKLIKLNTERDLLSQDWDDLINKSIPSSVDDLAKYKIATLGYDIGSKYVTGWGGKFAVPADWWTEADIQHLYIEGIFYILDSIYPFGIYYDANGLLNLISEEDKALGYDSILSNSCVKINIASNESLFFKTLFFEVDYTPFYSGSSVIARPDNRDIATINDNASESLSLLEKDGLFQQEKIKRFGNKGLQINARYTDISQLQPLGSVYNDTNAQDIVIYHREYSVYDNMISCQYYGTKNYVLKNYYTSVFARYRTWSLISYGESVKRAENEKNLIYLSKNKYYVDDDSNIKFFSKDTTITKTSILCSAFTPSALPKTIDYFENKNIINFGCLKLPLVSYDKDQNKNILSYDYFLADVNTFANGNSLCINVKMKNNLSSGTYIKNFEPDVSFLLNDTQNDYKGSLQSNYMNVESLSTGEIKNIEFVVGHYDYKDVYLDKVKEYKNNNEIKDIYNNSLFKLPKITNKNYKDSCLISFSNEANRYKDNKEYEDITFQFEPINNNDNIVFSNLFMQLSDLGAYYNKFLKEYQIEKVAIYWIDISLSCVNAKYGDLYVLAKILKSDYNKLKLQTEQGINSFNIDQPNNLVYSFKTDAFGRRVTFSYKYTKIYKIDQNNVPIYGDKNFCMDKVGRYYSDSVTDTFTFREETIDGYYIFEKKHYYQSKRGGFKQQPTTAHVVPPEDITLDKFIKTYPQNMYLLTSTKNISFQDVYKEIDFISWDSNKQFIKNQTIWQNSDKYNVILTNTTQESFSLERKIQMTVISEHSHTIEDNKSVLKCNIVGIVSIGDEIEYENETAVVWTPYEENGISYWLIKASPFGVFFNKIGQEAFEITNLVFQKEENSTITDLINNEYTVSSLSVNDVFYIDNDNHNKEYIMVDLCNVPETENSVQYWFANNNSIRLVFGVNITPEDRQRQYIKIYVSSLVKKDMRVFDDLHNVVGESYNYADGIAYKVPESQLYNSDYNSDILVNPFVYTNGKLGDQSKENGNAIVLGLRQIFNDAIFIDKTVLGIEENALKGLLMTSLDTEKPLDYYSLENCSEIEELTIPYMVIKPNEEYVFGKLFNLSPTTGDTHYLARQVYSESDNTVDTYIPNSLVNVTIKQAINDLNTLGIGFFSNCLSLININLPQNLTEISKKMFMGCISLSSVTVPDNVTLINENAFSNCKNLRYIILNKKQRVETTGLTAESNPDLIIFFKGKTETKWNNLQLIDTYLSQIKHYLYSETKPSIADKYWHYDENGNPLIWEI